MKPYVPQPLPLPSLDWGSLVRLIGQANAVLARYDGMLQGMVNPALFLSPLTTQEAVLSSRIEGTQATLQEVLEYEASPTEQPLDKLQDIQEIINYRAAIRMAVDTLQARPISLNLIRDIHSVLLDSVRGRNKARGQFRTTQNWIGPRGSSIEQATFVPPNSMGLMDHLSNLEKYIHYDELDTLVQLAIVHAQFEIIHPFLDGNGRVGRILVPLVLYEKGLLSNPVFYISAYLEAHRDTYYAKLLGVSRRRDWQGWVTFFLEAAIAQAKANGDKVQAILQLYERTKTNIAQRVRTQFAIEVLDALFNQPIFTTTSFVERSNIPKPSATRILSKLEKAGLMITLRKGRGRQPAMLMFPNLISIVEGKSVVSH